jgi:hypothetical protein
MNDQSPSPPAETAYRLNARDEILWVSSTWDGFALANQGGNCLGKSIEGTSLWDHITGDVTRMWLKSLLSVARNCQRIRDVAYRCDSPTERRFMRMRLIPEPDGNLLLEHTILERVARSKPVYPTYDPAAAIWRCSSCGRVLQNGRWVECDGPSVLAKASPRGQLPVVYGICESCQAALPGVP